MVVNLRLENANEQFIKAVKALARAFDVKVKAQKDGAKKSLDSLDALEADAIIDELKAGKRKLVSFDEAAKRLGI